MASNRNIIVLDTETSGLRPEDGCEVVQLAAKALNYWDLKDHTSGEFQVLIKPQRPEKAQQGALNVIGYDLWERAQKEGLEPKVAWKRFLEWVESVHGGKGHMTKPVIYAFNTKFDMGFIKFHLEECGLTPRNKSGAPDYPWGFEFDGMDLGYALFRNDPEVQRYTLDVMLGKLQMARATGTHDAMEDVRLFTQWLVRVLNFMTQAQKRMRVVTTESTPN